MVLAPDVWRRSLPVARTRRIKPGKREGFDSETKGALFFEVMRVINAKRPKVVFLENVKGLLTHDGGNTLKTIIDLLSSADEL